MNRLTEHPYEETRELVTSQEEMQEVAVLAKDCLDIALENEWAVVSDRSLYLGIPHSNGLRTLDIGLAFRDSSFSSIDIDLPRKDEDVRIRITANATDIPGRQIKLEEFENTDAKGNRKFFADDSHSVAFSRYKCPIDPVLEQEVVAEWLYAQAGIRPQKRARNVRRETDPVRNACDILSLEATQHFTIRQVKLPMSPDVELHGQLVECIDTNDPSAPPLARKYSVWINQYHEIGSTIVSERLFVEFSPDDIWLALDVSPMSSVQLMLETSDRRFSLGKAIVQQSISYEDGGIVATFASAYKQLAGYMPEPTQEQL
jgi:hypothetical protein